MKKRSVLLVMLIAASLFHPVLMPEMESGKAAQNEYYMTEPVEESAEKCAEQTEACGVEDTSQAPQIEAEDTYISKEYQQYCREIGDKYDICPELLMAMIEQESSGRKDVVNAEGDSGLLQVNPKWHYDRMEKLGVMDLKDPYSNILVAADYLAELFVAEEDVYLALMKYNMVHSTAEELHRQGIYSEYALEVTERAYELERLHEQEGE